MTGHEMFAAMWKTNGRPYVMTDEVAAKWAEWSKLNPQEPRPYAGHIDSESYPESDCLAWMVTGIEDLETSIFVEKDFKGDVAFVVASAFDGMQGNEFFAEQQPDIANWEAALEWARGEYADKIRPLSQKWHEKNDSKD
jgi:hypothetical protein